MGRFRVIGVNSPDPVLSCLGALALGITSGTALVVDLVGDMRTGTSRSLADLVVAGPSLEELAPGRAGVAILAGGGISCGEAAPLIELLASRWPAVVVRHGDGESSWPSVPVRGLLPGLLGPIDQGPAVWQPIGASRRPPGPGPVLPGLGQRLAGRLIGGRMATHSRWVMAWHPIWEMPWA
jgi:hypothetical protein